MKKFVIIIVLIIVIFKAKAQVGIGTHAPDSSAAFEIKDTARGILIPRMTMIQRNNIVRPAEGLMLFQIDSTKGYWYFDGLQWVNVNAQGNVPSTADYKRLKTQLYIKN